MCPKPLRIGSARPGVTEAILDHACEASRVCALGRFCNARQRKKSALSESHNSVSKPNARRRVRPQGCSPGPSRPHGRDPIEKSHISVSIDKAANSAVTMRPGGARIEAHGGGRPTVTGVASINRILVAKSTSAPPNSPSPVLRDHLAESVLINAAYGIK